MIEATVFFHADDDSAYGTGMVEGQITQVSSDVKLVTVETKVQEDGEECPTTQNRRGDCGSTGRRGATTTAGRDRDAHEMLT